MKKKIFLIFLMIFLFACPVWGDQLSGLGLIGLPSPEIEDDVYGSGWNADGTHGPSQNAMYDILHQYDTDDDGDVDNLDTDISGTTIRAKDSHGLWLTDDSGNAWQIHIADDGVITIGGSEIGFVISGTSIWKVEATSGDFTNVNGTRPVLINENCSSTNPNIIPNNLDENTGLSAGVAPTDVLYLIVGGVLGLEITEIVGGVTVEAKGDFTAQGDVNASGGTVYGAYYGSDGSVSDAELLYLDGVTSAIQAQIDSKYGSIGDLPTGIPDDDADTTHVALCSSTFNEFALHSGTSNVVSGATNSALIWVPADTNNLLAVLTGIESDPVILVISETGASHGDQKIIYNAGTIEIQIGTIDAQQEIVSGNTIYLPQQGIAKIIYVTDRWVASGHESNKISVKSIETPTLEAGELDDTSSPHTIVVAELKNVFLTNAGVGSGTTIEFDMPVAAEGWSFGVIVMDAGGGIIIDPNGTEQWYLNGTIQEAGENIEIEETVAGKSESIWCISCTESGVTTNVFCESKYSDWEGEND